MGDLTRERREDLRMALAEGYDAGASAADLDLTIGEVRALLDAADERDRLRAIYVTPLTPEEQAILDRAWHRDFTEKLTEAGIIPAKDSPDAPL